MPLQKQSIDISFAQGLDLKSDPFRIPLGKFFSLVNSVFTKMGLLTKRNGFSKITSFAGASNITTFSGNLVAVGSSLQAFSADNNTLINAGLIQPLSLSVVPLVRTATSQTTVDTAIASNNLSCTTWLDSNGNSYYQVSDSTTGQTVVPAAQLPSTATISRAFVLGQYFIVTFLATVAGSPTLQYIPIPMTSPSTPGPATTITTTVTSLSAAYDGYSAGGNLYLAWGRSSSIGVAYLTTTLGLSAPVTIAGNTANLMSVTADSTGSLVVWVTWWSSSGTAIKTTAYDGTLDSPALLGPTTVASSVTVNEITSSAASNVLNAFYEIANTYSYTPNAKTDYVSYNTCTIGGSVGTPVILLRGVGLGSKATYLPAMTRSYVVVAYGQTFQPTYFLMDQSGNVIGKIAYSNGGGYAVNEVLPQINVSGQTMSVGYLFRDLLEPVNKNQGAAVATGFYAQTGINIANFTLNTTIATSEIGHDLHLSGGFLWMYDGEKVVEHQFHVWPEDITAAWSASGGSVAAQPDGATNTDAYFYQVTYEWTDSQGNIHRSAPSVPLGVTTAGMGSSGSITLNIPTLRITYKTTNKVRIVIYRWSVGQQVYYQTTSIGSPLLNDPTVDSVTYVDTLSDASILGNAIIYTNGGVLEDIAAPASSLMTLFKSRLFLVDAEDPNLLWFSKQVIEAVPVEMTDLLTLFVAPTQGAQGSTGPITALSAMDDKLIVFKQDAIYYIVGNGPDNTGANDDFSDPIFVTSAVGCANPSSLVITPAGLMFQSDKGIWLLGRDLSTNYIGAPVENFNSLTVTSAEVIPATNQVRFTLSNNQWLMYDYYFQQWGSFVNLSAISSTLYNGLHTYLDALGNVFQETPNVYLDNTAPVLMSFVTSWINVAGVQGYERFYFLYLLGTYYTPFTLDVQMAYDYNASPSQAVTVYPDNFSPPWGGDPQWGSGQGWGGVSSPFQARVFPEKQKCEAFQVSVNEIYDPSMGAAAGQGLSLSGMNLVVGMKKGYRTQKASRQFG